MFEDFKTSEWKTWEDKFARERESAAQADKSRKQIKSVAVRRSLYGLPLSLLSFPPRHVHPPWVNGPQIMKISLEYAIEITNHFRVQENPKYRNTHHTRLVQWIEAFPRSSFLILTKHELFEGTAKPRLGRGMARRFGPISHRNRWNLWWLLPHLLFG